MALSHPVRVLVVDDSAYIRKVLVEMLSANSNIQVVGTARNGRDALEKTAELSPDVVTLDLIMPELDGEGYLREQMKRRRLPVIVVSIASESGEMVVRALEAGALDFVQKPTALATERIYEIQNDLIAKLLVAAAVEPGKLPGVFSAPPGAPAKHKAGGTVDAVVLGISTGGPQALSQLIPSLPKDFPAPLAVVLHMPLGYTALFAKRLDDLSTLEVVEASEGVEMRPGRVLIAQAGLHLSFLRLPDGRVISHLDLRPMDLLHRPAVDVMFQSAAEVYGSRLLGVVMTGMGDDGAAGCAWIKAQGGTVIAEAEESCVVFGMPRAVIDAGLADVIAPLDRMADTIIRHS
ncbi:MAG: chemotaxis-specific protein-glutamate methyltransferase CheB [Chloroflexota bacterium]